MSEIHISRATAADVEAIVAMLADDHLGRQRESAGDPAPHRRAFEAIDADPNQFLAVAEDAGEVIGSCS